MHMSTETHNISSTAKIWYEKKLLFQTPQANHFITASQNTQGEPLIGKA